MGIIETGTTEIRTKKEGIKEDLELMIKNIGQDYENTSAHKKYFMAMETLEKEGSLNKKEIRSFETKYYETLRNIYLNF